LDYHLLMWIVFGAIIAIVLALDLFVLHKKPHAVSLRESMMWSGIWIAIALAYGGALWLMGDYGFGPTLAKQYLAGYVIELALSVDNLFVFAVIFAALSVKREHQHKLLFWGVFGALVLRAIFIFAGVAIIEMFAWTMYIFGGILILSAVKLLIQGEKEIDPNKSLIIRAVKKVFPVRPDISGPTFWVTVDGKRYATMLFVGLILVEVTDVIFAIDSIPAVLAVAVDPVTGKADTLVVYASNAFAIMGLRSLYFALAGIMAAFRFLKYGLVAILAFVGAKMIIGQGIPGVFPKYHMPIEASLGVIGGVLALCVVLSLVIPRKAVVKHEETLVPNPPEESPTPRGPEA
jgi:tellurite resistance protein TerC